MGHWPTSDADPRSCFKVAAKRKIFITRVRQCVHLPTHCRLSSFSSGFATSGQSAVPLCRCHPPISPEQTCSQIGCMTSSTSITSGSWHKKRDVTRSFHPVVPMHCSSSSPPHLSYSQPQTLNTTRNPFPSPAPQRLPGHEGEREGLVPWHAARGTVAPPGVPLRGSFLLPQVCFVAASSFHKCADRFEISVTLCAEGTWRSRGTTCIGSGAFTAGIVRPQGLGPRH